MKYFKWLIAIIFLACTLSAADIAIWFGNPDSSPLVFRVGSDETVPVWIHTNEDVYIAAVHIPLSSDDRYVYERMGADMYAPFKNDDVPEGFDKDWDVVDIFEPKPHKDKDGYTSQSLLAFMNLIKGPNLPLHCEDTCKIMEYRLKTAADDSLKGRTFDVFIEGFDDRSKGLHFSDTLGGRTFDYEACFSQVYYVFPGDINDDQKIDDADIKELKYHLEKNKEIPWPVERADCNDDGVIDREDLSWLKEYLENLNLELR